MAPYFFSPFFDHFTPSGMVFGEGHFHSKIAPRVAPYFFSPFLDHFTPSGMVFGEGHFCQKIAPKARTYFFHSIFHHFPPQPTMDITHKYHQEGPQAISLLATFCGWYHQFWDLKTTLPRSPRWMLMKGVPFLRVPGEILESQFRIRPQASVSGISR